MRNAPLWVVDALLSVAVSLALVLVIATNDSGHKAGGFVPYLFAIGFGSLLLLRRRMPRSILTLSVLGIFAYYTLDYPPIGVAVPVMAALFSASEAGLVLWSIGTATVVFVVSTFFRLLEGTESIGFILGYESVSNIALFSAAIALGYALNARRSQVRQQAEILNLKEEQFARDGEMRMQFEREQISRELHDTVGHTMSVIALHAGVASESIGNDDSAAREALESIRNTSSKTLQELRSMVRILRVTAHGHESRSIQSLSEISELIATPRTAGVEVTADIAISPSELSPAVDAAAYRVLQEALTNVMRHSNATSTHIKAHTVDGQLHVAVSDDGRGASAREEVTGNGIAGMKERVKLLGGSLTVETEPGSGFSVEAMIPARLP